MNKELDFKDRILKYRQELGVKTQKEMAEKIGIARQLYSNLENGYKNPSKQVLDKIVSFSGQPEEYWLYGVEGKEYIDERQEFKCLHSIIEDLKETNLLNLVNGEFDKEVESILLNALKADISHMLLKEKMK